MLKTPGSIVINRVVLLGKVIDISISNMIVNLIDAKLIKDTHLIIDVFIDGVQFLKGNRQKSFYVILGRTQGHIFPISVCNGTNQPEDFNDLITIALKRIRKLNSEKLSVNNVIYQVFLGCFPLDSIARAQITFTQFPTGRHSCDHFYILGERINGRTCFIHTDSPLRLDSEFRARTDPEHHRGMSIIVLHLVYLGVVKKMLVYLFHPPKAILPLTCQKDVSKSLENINRYLQPSFTVNSDH